MVDQGGIRTGERRGILAVISAALVSCLLVFWPGMSFALPQFGVHVSSFRNPENAETEIADYRARGLEAYAVYETVPDKGLWYRVYLGRFDSYNMAVAAGQRLMGRGIIDYYDIGRVDDPGYGNHTTLKAKADTFEQDLLYPDQVGARGSQGKFEPIDTAPPDPGEAASIKRRLYQDAPNVNGPRTKPYTPAPPLQDPRNQSNTQGRFDSLLDRPPVEASPRPAAPNRVPPQPAEPPAQNGRFSDPFAKIPPDVMAQLREPVEEESESWADKKSTFSLSAKTGMAFWPHSSDFSVLRASGSTIDRWFIDDNDARGLHHAIVGSLNIWEFLNLDASLEKEFANNLDLWYLTLGPRASFSFQNDMSVYFKNCLAFGFLNWDGLPGDIDNGFGLDWGLGFDYNVGNLTIGAELLYRWIDYGYNAPSDAAASSDSIDFTGFVLSWSIGYLF